LEMSVADLMSANIIQCLGTMLDTVVFRLCLSYSYSNGIIISIIYLLTTCLLYLGPVSIVVAMALQTSLHDYNYNLESLFRLY
jgi:hypothetical protein